MPRAAPVVASFAIFIGFSAIFFSNALVFHVVDEGHRGLYYTLGALSEVVSEPGLHFRLPPPLQVATQVHVRPEVDTVEHLRCTAKDGTQIIFPAIDVGNTLPPEKAHGIVKKYGVNYDKFLVYDQVKALVNTICAQYTSHELKIEKYSIIDDDLKEGLEEIQERLGTGLTIDSVRINEVVLPRALQEAYEQQATNRAEKKAAEEAFKRIEQENNNHALEVRGQNEMKRLKAAEEDKMMVASAEARLSVEVKEAETRNAIQLKKAKNDAEMLLVEAKAKAEAIRLQADANKLLHTPAYLQLQSSTALLNNSKLIFGSELPKNAFAVDMLAKM